MNGDVAVNPTAETSVISYKNPSIALKVGDVIHYWIYVQHNYLGYRRESQQWQVKGNLRVLQFIFHRKCNYCDDMFYFCFLALKKDSGDSCVTSQTTASDQLVVCKDTIVFEDNFNQNVIDENKWLIEQYFPTDPVSVI